MKKNMQKIVVLMLVGLSGQVMAMGRGLAFTTRQPYSLLQKNLIHGNQFANAAEIFARKQAITAQADKRIDAMHARSRAITLARQEQLAHEQRVKPLTNPQNGYNRAYVGLAYELHPQMMMCTVLKAYASYRADRMEQELKDDKRRFRRWMIFNGVMLAAIGTSFLLGPKAK